MTRTPTYVEAEWALAEALDDLDYHGDIQIDGETARFWVGSGEVVFYDEEDNESVAFDVGII